MEFGLPKIRERKIEKYPNVALLTFHPTGEGLGRKMELSEAAIDILGLSSQANQVSFSFSGADIYIVNTSGVENSSGLKVGKTTNSFSDKKHYNFIKENMYKVPENEELELFFEATDQEFNGNKVFKLVKDNPSEKEVATEEEDSFPSDTNEFSSELSEEELENLHYEDMMRYNSEIDAEQNQEMIQDELIQLT